MYIARQHEEDRRCASALSRLCRRRVRYLNRVVPFSFFLFFFVYSVFASTTDRARRFIDWKSKSEFNFGESRFIFPPIHILRKIDCTFAFIYFYSRTEISNSTDKRNPFFTSFIEVKSADMRDGVSRSRLVARSRSVICVTSLRFNDES